MIKKDISMIALIFFITRCFFNLYTINNLYSFILIAFLLLVIIIIMKQIKTDFFKSKIFTYIYLISLILIFVIILSNTTLFINNNYFKYNNLFVIVISLLVITYFLGKGTIKTIGSISEIFSIFFIIISIIIYMGLISLVRLNNYTDFVKINNFNISLLPFLLVIVVFYLKNKNIITGYFLGIISTFIDTFLLIGCLGTSLIKTYKFPGISILKSLNFFNFINHLDKLFSFIYLFEYTITLALIFYIIKDIIKKLKN